MSVGDSLRAVAPQLRPGRRADAPHGVTFPDRCPQCRRTEFEHVGFGLWHGQGAAGVFQKARCRGCGVIWFGTRSQGLGDDWGEPTWVRCDW